ncbi:MFS general substrate transporter [Lojkania enalia]|uniref:MFS general substrate transporter n=1 Tax=Lojkania enalia TaxID=147567 RepID=A0A9P4JYE3_9PLEO|nr:MFS general substrate transporter [Didymosphaeria enalia]
MSKYSEESSKNINPTRPTKGVDSKPEPRYASTKELVAIIPALLLCIFLIALDRTIIATAIPRVTDEFHSLKDVGWYASSYLLPFGSFQLMFGRIYTFFNPKWVLLAAILIFEVGSTVAGAAPSSTALIIGRAISGLGASGIFGGVVIILVHAVPLHRRPIFQGMMGGAFGIASVIGPLLGGAFTTSVSWRWCFYINLPIGGFVMVVLAFILRLDIKREETFTWRQKLAKLDLLGNATLLPSIICLLLALQWGGSTYPWNNWRIILMFILFGILILAFGLIQQRKQENATVPPRILKNRSILSAVFFSFCTDGGATVFIYYIPIWFQAIKGSSAVESGIQNLAAVIAMVVGSVVAGGAVQQLGYYAPFMIAASFVGSIGAGLITTWQVNTGHAKWIGYQVLWGFGFSMGMQQAGLAAQAVLSVDDAPTGISLVFFARTMGGAVFTSVAQNMFTNKLVSGLEHLASSNPKAIVNTGATELRSVVSANDLPQVLWAYNKAIVAAFYAAVGLSCASILGAVTIEWKT